MNIKTKILTVFLVILFLIVLSGVIYFYSVKFLPIKKQVEKQPEKVTHEYCLIENEFAHYETIERKEGKRLVNISIREKQTNKEIFNFRINDVFDGYALETHKCGVYVIRSFEFDEKKSIHKRHEFWRYTYDGNGNILMSNEEFRPYSLDFRVDPTEIFIVLERSYLGNPDYALVIKDLKTKEDVFVLLLKEIVDKYPDLEGSIGFNEWTKDGKYFWGNIFVEANVLAFFRIERDTWKYEIFKAPPGTMGGDALNTELGYVTYDDGPPWTGDLDWAKLYQEEWEKEGKIVSFYLYNFFTNKKTVLATTTDTMWYFKPNWLSERELEYYLPSGERKIYVVK